MKRAIALPILTAVFLAAGAATLPGPASAKLTNATVDADGWLSRGGSYALFTVPLVCTARETFTLRATLGQAATRSQAVGNLDGICAGDVQAPSLRTTVLDGYQTLSAGAAQLCWNLTTRAGEARTGYTQQCSRVTLAFPPRS